MTQTYRHIPPLIVKGALLYQTCFACPEQYDVFFPGVQPQIGYLRLRHGGFTASYPDYNGVDVYSASPKGDGCFEAEERMFYLENAVDALIKEHNKAALEQLDFNDL